MITDSKQRHRWPYGLLSGCCRLLAPCGKLYLYRFITKNFQFARGKCWSYLFQASIFSWAKYYPIIFEISIETHIHPTRLSSSFFCFESQFGECVLFLHSNYIAQTNPRIEIFPHSSRLFGWFVLFCLLDKDSLASWTPMVFYRFAWHPKSATKSFVAKPDVLSSKKPLGKSIGIRPPPPQTWTAPQHPKNLPI